MTGPPERALVYDRIDANRRNTRRLLGVFALALLPVASGATVWLMPWLAIPVGLIVLSSPALQESLQRIDVTQLIVLEGGLLVTSLLLVTLGIALVATFLIHRSSARLVLRMVRARPVQRDDELELHRIVENLCIATGAPKPRLYTIESGAANAFAVGRDPERSAIAVTRGLLTRLERRELEGAIAHELSHVRNQDVRLSTTLAGLTATLRLPLRLLAALGRRPRLAAVMLLLTAPLFGGLATAASLLFSEELATLPPFLRWWNLHALAAPLYAILLAPLAAALLRRAVSWEREFLADADAVLVTRNPGALASALRKASTPEGAPLVADAAIAHLYFVDPTDGSKSWIPRRLHSHPPLEDRLERLARMGSAVATEAAEEPRRRLAGALR